MRTLTYYVLIEPAELESRRAPKGSNSHAKVEPTWKQNVRKIDLGGDLLWKIPLLAAQHHRTLQALVAGVEHILRKTRECQLDVFSFNQDVLVK